MPKPEEQRTLYTRADTLTQAAIGLQAWQGQPARMVVSHRHNELELNLVEQGSATYVFGGRRIQLPAGTLVLFWAVAPHQLVESAPQTRMYWLTLPLAWFLRQTWPEPFRRAVLNSQLIYDHHPRPTDPALFQQWQADLTRNQPEDREIVLLEVLARLRRLAAVMVNPPGMPADQPSPPPGTPPAQRPRKVGQPDASGPYQTPAERMAAYLSDHFLEEVRVDAAAAQVGLHPNYAMHLFRTAYGQTMVEYITQLRIAYAQQMLVSSDHNVVDIALQSGFGSVSQFYAAFKRLCGLSPRAYRDSLR